MYSILGLYNKDGNISYAVSDKTREDFDIFSESELKLLISSGISILDSNDSRVSLNNGVLSMGDIPDLTNEVSEYCDDAELDEYDIYDDLEEDYFEEEDSEEEDSDEDYIDYDEEELIEEDDDDEDEEEIIEDGYEDEELIEEDDEEPEESTVSKLYNFLNEEQITVLKRYYLWYSQRLFTDAQKDPTLGIKSQTVLNRKKANLSQLRNSGGMWYYAGFVDMGYKGAGYCTLGHPLRFMHLAWDVTVSDIETAFFGEDYNSNFEEAIESANCIKFGIKCISDFFEVDSECTRSLQRAQRESLKDMSLMYEHYANGTVDEVCSTFKFMDELLRWVAKIDTRNSVVYRDNYKPIINRNLSLFYTQFRKINMIPPKSLIQEIRDHIVGWEYHVERHGHIKMPNFDVLIDNFKKIWSGEFDGVAEGLSRYNFTSVTNYFANVGWRKQALAYLFRAFMYESCGYYAYNADTNTEEGGASKGARSEYTHMIENSSRYFFEGVEFSLAYMNRLCKLFKFKPIDKFDERFKIPQGVVDDANPPYLKISDDYTKPAFLLMGLYEEETGINLDKALRDLHEVDNGYRVLQYPEKLVKDHLKGVNFTLDELESLIYGYDKILRDNIDAFRQWCIDREQKRIDDENARIKALELKHQIEDKVNESVIEQSAKSPEEVVEYLKSKDLSGLDKSFDLSKNILSTVISSGNAPSSKQFWYIKKLYEEVSGKKFEGQGVAGEKVSLDDRQDLQKVVDYVRSHKSDFSSIVCSICDSVFKYRSISEKQMKFILEAQAQMK